ncbi:hypothetical protein BV898_19217 [Hypsibius exemplaris]|uniref:Uncharacterized protein n=1 Tax=Hypsibius exemplaris TaxID=2072580 RepID=A0A9X6NL20_HYPEX|nr:hypothetical protein BV898_19217 [Hypsibius exemplaris]
MELQPFLSRGNNNSDSSHSPSRPGNLIATEDYLNDNFIKSPPVNHSLQRNGVSPVDEGFHTDRFNRLAKILKDEWEVISQQMIQDSINYWMSRVHKNAAVILRVLRKITSPDMLAAEWSCDHWLKSLLYFIPKLTAAVRGVLILAITLHKRNTWDNLKQHTIEFVALCFTDPEAERRLYRKIKQLSVVSLLASVALLLLDLLDLRGLD